jgi:hypothetical protein
LAGSKGVDARIREHDEVIAGQCPGNLVFLARRDTSIGQPSKFAWQQNFKRERRGERRLHAIAFVTQRLA